MSRMAGGIFLAALMFAVGAARAEVSQADWEALKKEMADLRKDNAEIRKQNDELAGKVNPIKSSVDKMLDTKYGPGAAVTTKVGKLQISGLLQVWYYSIQNDTKGLFEDDTLNDIHDTNEANDNDSFRIRRSEIKFIMDINDYVKAEVMIDPAREAQSFPGMSSNTATAKRGLNVNLANVQGGVGAAPRLLQDAFVEFHHLTPHHDFKIGQYKPPFGEEGIRSSSQLDFVERSMIGQIGDARDQGITAHGEWWGSDGKGAGRFQYWLGAFNAPGNFQASGGQFQNRSDDNDAKDFVYRVLVRPLWKNECWGNLELGMSSQFGKHGESGARDPIDTPLNGLNRNTTWAIRHDAWAYYAPGSAVRGLWFRGEWAAYKDRNAPQQVIDLLGQGGATGDQTTQTNPKPFWSSGWYFATGYKIMDSRWGGDCPHWFKGFEFTFRYDCMTNVTTADLVKPDHTDVFRTNIWTGGINYYIKNHNAKIQANYNIVDNPETGHNPNRNFHDVRNDNFVVNFQVAF
jgi:hypothetical protein